ncbi:GNAT family N-acetyltransferase [Bacillus weihaiensis]|uniref:GNAT family acetyltransferase n=1 Tax=Bacillus weihaiensis TaxID=1547283 RepID=A0A1L3MN29_9BACI|nr:GNAT family N-acetyltransferase [Bacillus weihaiensis]APH03746.1 GNAT family acetyltransferase [Bacillus weihaiensis]
MMNTKDIEELDIAYISSFATKIDTSWGYLFFNEDQPDYYDANHANISTYTGHYEEIIEEVVTFYQSKKLIPRFYLSHYEEHQDFVDALKQRGFGFEEFASPVQLWTKKVYVKQDPLVSIEKVTKENKQVAIDIECEIPELGGSIRKKAFEQEFQHSGYTHYLLKYNNIPCSTACVFEHERDARLESVATLKDFRGKGLIGQLIHSIQQEVEQKDIERLWVMPINEKVEKVYMKSGFETILTMMGGHAFFGGKSLEDVRKGL